MLFFPGTKRDYLEPQLESEEANKEADSLPISRYDKLVGKLLQQFETGNQLEKHKQGRYAFNVAPVFHLPPFGRENGAGEGSRYTPL